MASLGGPLGHDCRPNAHVVAVGNRNNVFQYCLFVPARTNSGASAPRRASARTAT